MTFFLVLALIVSLIINRLTSFYNENWSVFWAFAYFKMYCILIKIIQIMWLVLLFRIFDKDCNPFSCAKMSSFDIFVIRQLSPSSKKHKHCSNSMICHNIFIYCLVFLHLFIKRDDWNFTQIFWLFVITPSCLLKCW